MKLAAPLIIGAHVTHLPTLTGWDAAGDRPAMVVYEGQATRRDPVPRWVTVGYLAGDDGPAVHIVPTTNGQRQNREGGSIVCGLVVTAPDIAAARTAAFGLLEPWTEWLATDHTLGGVLQADTSVSLVADVALTTTRAGATASAVVTITYTATTYG